MNLTGSLRRQWGFESAGTVDVGCKGTKALSDTHALLNVRTAEQHFCRYCCCCCCLPLAVSTDKTHNGLPPYLLQVRRLQYDELTMVLKRVFEKYNSWEHGVNKSEMDKMRFQKVMRDAELLDEQASGLTAEEVGKVFARCKPGSRTALNFFSFCEGLRHVAVRKRISLNEVMERIVLVGGPVDSRLASARVPHLQALSASAADKLYSKLSDAHVASSDLQPAA
jgi:hypothetical protein